ncbi:MAG: amidohydrolase [Dehalococcoidia bacterium]
MTKPRDLVLHNANVLTMDARCPQAGAVMCRDGRILRVDQRLDESLSEDRGSTILDCRGRTVVPGFIDSHTHFLAYASSLTSVDCGPGAVKSIAEARDAIAQRAQRTLEGQWVRATGYNEFYLAERRHPNRWDLDGATRRHPVKLVHRSGHACVLNSYAMGLAGITNETPEPEAGVIERDLETGEPTGLFIEMDDWLEERLGLTTRAGEMAEAVRLASERYISLGITSFHEASPCNSLQRWRFFQRMKKEGGLSPRITMMPGYGHLQELVDAGLGFGAGDENLKVGHAKVMLSQTSGRLLPPQEELRAMVLSAASRGFPVAIHAVEEAEIEAAIDALEWLTKQTPNPGLRHRIEHCSLCPAGLRERLKRLGIVIVTQPGFVYYSGERYLCQVSAEQIPWLYPIKSWREMGLRVAGSSDSPVAPPDPLVAMRAAVTRRSARGDGVGLGAGISALEALEMYTIEGAYASGQEESRGRITPGMLADMVVLSDDPTRGNPEDMASIRVWGTILGGELIWQAESEAHPQM